MEKTVISTEAAPAAIGPYSQAVRVGDTVYCSGQIPLDPTTMEVSQEDFAGQAKQVFENLKAVAEAAGGTCDHFVKINIYLIDLGHFATVNELMAQYFNEPYPARAAVQVAALPKGVQIEIEGVMAL